MKRTASAGKSSNARGTSIPARRPSRRAPAAFAVCVANDGYAASLERHKIYRVLPDAVAARDGDVRVVDESGEDYLYPEEWFEPVEVTGRVRRSLLRVG